SHTATLCKGSGVCIRVRTVSHALPIIFSAAHASALAMTKVEPTPFLIETAGFTRSRTYTSQTAHSCRHLVGQILPLPLRQTRSVLLTRLRRTYEHVTSKSTAEVARAGCHRCSRPCHLACRVVRRCVYRRQ